MAPAHNRRNANRHTSLNNDNNNSTAHSMIKKHKILFINFVAFSPPSSQVRYIHQQTLVAKSIIQHMPFMAVHDTDKHFYSSLRMSTTQRMQSPECMSWKAWLMPLRGWRWVMNSSTFSLPVM